MTRVRPRRSPPIAFFALLAFLALFALFWLVPACGGGRGADAPHGGDDDELPDPKAPNDLPDDPGKPFEEGDKPLVDPAKEMPRPAGSASATPKR